MSYLGFSDLALIALSSLFGLWLTWERWREQRPGRKRAESPRLTPAATVVTRNLV
jgi:hypothetical protein